MPDDAFDIIQKIHVRAPFRLIRQAAPYFRIKVLVILSFIQIINIPLQSENHENRSIVNVSSTTGLHGNVGQANYAVAKSSVIGLTKTIAKEWGPFGVRANTIAFGLIHTRLTASKEAGETIDIDGKKVALGVPGPQRPILDATKQNSDAYPLIPLRRGGSTDEAASAVLL